MSFRRILVDGTGRASIGEVMLADGTIDDVLDDMVGRATRNAVTVVATINVDHVVELAGNLEFGAFYTRADLVVADGAPIVLLARMLGARDVNRVTGADLLPAMVARAARTGQRVVVVGGQDRVREDALAALAAAHAGADLHGVSFPLITSVADERSQDVIDAIRQLEPHVVFLSLGSPKQELWLGRWVDVLPPAVYVGVGAAVDFAAGTAQRAPQWMQSVGAEWLWRLAREPKRLAGRYLGRGPRFLGFAARSILRRD